MTLTFASHLKSIMAKLGLYLEKYLSNYSSVHVPLSINYKSIVVLRIDGGFHTTRSNNYVAIFDHQARFPFF